MQNDSAKATGGVDVVDGVDGADSTADSAPDSTPDSAPEGSAPGGSAPEAASSVAEAAAPDDAALAETPATEVPQPRATEPDSAPGKGKKRKSAPKPKSAAGTKSLVVLREGKVHYADESVVVLDLDDAANPDTDVHDVVDKLSELRDAAESAGRTEAVALVAELIQAKALA